MRLIKIGDHPSSVGEDVRAALTSWSRGDSVVGGIALIGPQPPGCAGPVDAVVVLPRGVLVVVGVDLPDPAMRLEAPLAGAWKTDGWPLVGPGGAEGPVNPATDALAASESITALLEGKAEPVPVSTIVAVGPYVSQVSQPTADLMRGVRILHPEPMTLLTAARELAVRERPCTVRQAQGILAVLAPGTALLAEEDLLAEGFSDAAAPDLSTSSTTVIPRVRETPAAKPAKTTRSRSLRWLPVAAAGLVGLLLLTGIIVAVASASGDDPQPAGQQQPPPARTTTPARSATVAATTTPKPSGSAATPTVRDSEFATKDVVQDADCAADTTGDMQVWLQQHGCDRLIRGRYVVRVNGKRAAVLLAVLVFPDSGSATAFQGVADTPGSGTVLDPAAQGKAWPDNLRPSFASAGYASSVDGSSVKVAQAVWLDGATAPSDPALAGIARRTLLLPPPQ